jgi:hypothetical protein
VDVQRSGVLLTSSDREKRGQLKKAGERGRQFWFRISVLRLGGSRYGIPEKRELDKTEKLGSAGMDMSGVH